MKSSKKSTEYVVRFERGGVVLVSNRAEERFAMPARIGLALAGFLLLAGLGLGLTILIGAEIHDGDWAYILIGFLVAVPALLVGGGCGVDLVGRGISGRPWSRRYWQVVERWAAAHVKTWHGGVVLLLIFAASLLDELATRGVAGLAILMVPLAALTQVILHEAGHLSTAGAVGYRPRHLAAGPLILHLDGPRPRISVSFAWQRFFGGLASYEPVGRTRQKDFWVVAAGPLANFLFAALALDRWGWRDDPDAAGTFVQAFIWMGVLMGLVNLIPLPRLSGGFALDGRELLDLLREHSPRPDTES